MGSGMSDEDIVRDMVLKRLLDAGWISEGRTLSHAGPPQRWSYRLKWTALGWENRRLLNGLFRDLGCESGYRIGELEELHRLCSIHPDEEPPPPASPTIPPRH
jgi:hypothetical protein